jgi:hypothetical protein
MEYCKDRGVRYKKIEIKIRSKVNDAPSNSLIDSIPILKVKTTKG